MEAINSGDTAWTLASAALLLLSGVGLALFHSGPSGAKYSAETLRRCFAAFLIVALQWALIGHSLVFGASIFGLIGNADLALLAGVGIGPREGQTVPHLAFAIYEIASACLVPAILAGALVRRLHFGSYCLFVLLWTTLVYAPLAHWVWNPEGWLAQLGARDFAGGAVIQIAAGSSAFFALALTQDRIFLKIDADASPSGRMVLMLAGLAAVAGWFGSAGNTFVADGPAAAAVVNFLIAAATACLVRSLLEWQLSGRLSDRGLVGGAIAGLASAAPSAACLDPRAAAIIASAAALASYLAILALRRLSDDPAWEAVGIHGVAGIAGVVAAAAFLPATACGAAIEGARAFMCSQLVLVAVAIALPVSGTALILRFADKFFKPKIDELE